MFYKFQTYLCLIVCIYLMCCLVHDLCFYHEIQAEKIAALKKQEEMRQKLSPRLDDLIHLIEEKQINNKNKERLINLNNRLNK